MLIVFVDYRGVVHSQFFPEGQTVNKEYYLGVMKRLREQIRQKRADLLKENSWILCNDNAPSHKAIIVNEFLARNSPNIIEHKREFAARTKTISENAFKNVLMIGLFIGISVLFREGPALKAIK